MAAGDVLGVLGEALILLRADGTQLSADMKKQRDEIEKSLKKVGEDLKSVGSAMTVGLTVPIIGFGTAATKSFMDFESGMNRVRAAFDPTEAQFKDLEAAAQEWGAKTKFSSAEAAEGLAELGKAGFTSAQAIGALPAVLELATVSGMSLADAATLTADTIKQFNLTVADAAHVNDVLVKAAQSSTIDVQQLGESFKYAGPVAAGFGMTIEDTAAILAAFGNSGIKAEMAGTALRNILTDLATPTKGMRDGMEQLGIETLRSADGTFKLTDVVDKLRDAMKNGYTDTERAALVMQMFGDRAGPAMVSMVSKGSGEIRNMQKAIADAEGAAKKAAETQMAGLGGAIEKMGGSVQTAGAAIGKVLAPAVIAVADLIGKLADLVTQYVVPAFDKLPGPIKIAVGIIFGIVALAGPITYALGQIVISYTAVATAATRLVGPVLSANAAMAGSGAAGTAGAAGMLAFVAAWAKLVALPAAILYVSVKGADQMKEKDPLAYDLMAQAYGGGYDSGEESAMEAAKRKAEITKKLRGEIEALASSVNKHTGETKTNTGATNDNADAQANNAGKIGLGTKALAAAKKELASLSPEIKKDIIAYDAMGKSVEEIAKAVGKSEAAVGMFIKASKAGAEAAKAHADAMQKLRDQYSGKDLLDNARNLSEVLNSGLQLTKRELEEMAPVFERAIEKMIVRGESKTPEFRQLLQDWLKAIAPSQQVADHWADGFWQELMRATRVRGPSLITTALGDTMSQSLVKAMPAIKPGLERFVDEATGEIGLRVKKTGEVIIGPSLMDGIFAGFKTEEFARRISDIIVSAFTGDASAREVGSALGQTIGTTVGQAIGAGVGGIVGNVIFPVVGGLVGAWLGGYIGGLFGGDDEQAQAARQLRDNILEAMGGRDGLTDAVKQAIIAGIEAPGAPMRRPGWADEYIDTILNSGDPEAIQQAWDRLQPMIEEVKKQFEGLGQAVKGVNQYADALKDSFNKTMKETDDAMLAKNKAIIDAMKERGATNDEIEKQEIAFAEESKNRTYEATQAQIQMYGHLGNYVAATFADLVRRTGDPVAAIMQMEGAFNLLKEAGEKFNLEGTATTQRMVSLYNTINNNKDVFESLSGLSQIMMGLGKATVVTKDLAADFGKDLAEHFKTLEERGVDTRVAMALMQPQLQQLWEAQQKFGKFTDEATNAMLEQAEAQGIVGADMRDVNEKVLDVLIAIADVFGAKIPEGVRRAQSAIDGLSPPDDIDVVVRPRIEYPDDWPGGSGDVEYTPPDWQGRVPELDHGGYSNWGMGARAVLHGREIVMPETKMNEWLETALPRVGDTLLEKMTSMPRGGDITIAPQFSGMLANEARQFMQEQFVPMMITVLRDVGPLREQMMTTLER